MELAHGMKRTAMYKKQAKSRRCLQAFAGPGKFSFSCLKTLTGSFLTFFLRKDDSELPYPKKGFCHFLVYAEFQ